VARTAVCAAAACQKIIIINKEDKDMRRPSEAAAAACRVTGLPAGFSTISPLINSLSSPETET